MAAEKTLREFSMPAVPNVATGLAVDTAGKNFELRTGLITMVQVNPFYGLPSEDANAHFQHFLELCDTIVIKDICRCFPHEGSHQRVNLYACSLS